MERERERERDRLKDREKASLTKMRELEKKVMKLEAEAKRRDTVENAR
jgi:hypothetical protein